MPSPAETISPTGEMGAEILALLLPSLHVILSGAIGSGLSYNVYASITPKDCGNFTINNTATRVINYI